MELLARDRQLADLEVLAADRLAEIKKLEQSAGEHTRQIDLLLAERSRLAARVEHLTGEVDRLSFELERVKSAPNQVDWPQSRHPSPLSIHTGFLSGHPSPPSRRLSPVRSRVIAELKQLLENNQVTAKRLKDELNQISRKSKDEDVAVAGLHSVYKELSSCCTELEVSLHQSSADFDRLFTPELVSALFSLCSTPSQYPLLICCHSFSPTYKPTISLKITDRSFRYASPRLWNQLPDSFRQPRQSCLDSPPHSLVSSSLLSSPRL